MNTNTTLYTIETLNGRSGKTDAYDEIRMIDEAGQLYVTYVVPGYGNKQNWNTIVNNPDLGFVLHNCTIKSSRGKPKRVATGMMTGAYIVDADSYPVIDMHMPASELREFIRDEIASKGNKKPDDDDESPFEFGKFKT